jgi:hypothetical protein
MRIRPLSEEPAKEVKWLWRPYIPYGAVTILEGDPGSGKSWLVMNITAAITNGRALPYKRRSSPKGVIYLSAEDDSSTVIRPRLELMGANLDRVFTIDMTKSSRLLDIMNSAIEDVGKVGMVVIDPIQAFFPSMYGLSVVRDTMFSLYTTASEKDIAVVCIRHFTKGGRGMYRGLGSIDLAAAARSILVTGTTLAYPDIRVMGHLKSSYAEVGNSLGYIIDKHGFKWTGEVDVSAADLLSTSPTSEVRSALEEAKEFLLTMLEDGEALAKDVRREASELGISSGTLMRARRHLGVKAKKVGGRGGYWVLTMR